MAGKREGLVLKGGAHSALQGSPPDLFAHNCPPRPDCAQPAHHHNHHHQQDCHNVQHQRHHCQHHLNCHRWICLAGTLPQYLGGEF